MKLVNRTPVHVVVLLFLLNNAIECAKINTPRVLLPWFADTQVNFTFEIFEGGCYSWSLSRDDIIDLEPLYDSWGQCSHAARVSVSKSCSPPGTVIILAEEVNTREILRGDVDIDKISALKVTSTTWTLFLEEAPEAFEVVAYDEQGNTFSSLEGISFTWTVQNIGENLNEEPLVRLEQWSNTDYEAPHGVTDLEAKGLQSYTVLLYGQAMGDTKVTVCLGGDICTEFSLQVIASVVLTPAVAYIAPGDTLRYRVVRARAGRLTIEDLVDTIYYLKVPSDSTVELEDSISLVRGQTLGTTTVSLVSGAVTVATANVTVTQPHSIKVVIRPANLVVTGEYFTIHCTVYDKRGRAMIAGDEMLMRLTVDGDGVVELLRSTENGTLTDAIAHAPGVFTVTATLYSVAGKIFKEKIEGQASANAVSPLEVVPEELFVAWSDITQEVTLKHQGGGDEAVIWDRSEIDTQSALSLSPAAVVTVKGVGDIGVKVQLKNYPYVMAFGRVWSAPAEYIQVYSPGDARVGRVHHLHIALTGTHPATGELFNFHVCDCGSLVLTHVDGPEPFDVSAENQILPLEGACCVLRVTWRARGVSAVRASLGRAADSARVVVRASPQLLWPPGDAAALVDAQRTVIALGEVLSPLTSDPKIVEIIEKEGASPFKYPDAKLFTIKCRKKGEARIDLISQSMDDDESVQFGVACATHVSKIKLEPSEPSANCTGGPRIWLRPEQDAFMRVTLLDSVGRELLSERGTKASWEISPKHNGIELRSPNTLLVENHPEFTPVPVAYRFYQIVVADQRAVGWSGTIKVSLPDATATIQARVAAPLKCEPCRVNLAWEGEELYSVTSITGGSGRYSVEGHKGLSPTIEDGALKSLLPATGSYEFVVTDACMPNERVVVHVNIEEIQSIEVSSSRAVCVGACVPATVVLRGVSRASLVSGRESRAEWRGSAHVRVAGAGGEVCGVKEGAGRVRAGLGGLWSNDAEIIVFPPLSVVPGWVRVPPGSRLQLSRAGGPPPQVATLHYTLSGDERGTRPVEVSNSGLLQAVSVGSARVRLVATDSSNVEMASAEATVEVIPITGLKVRSATSTLLVNNPSPVWVEAEGLTASSLATIQPPPKVTWSLRDPSTARLYMTHIDDMLERSVAEGMSIRVVPLKGGVVTIDVRVRNMLTDTRVWESSIEIIAVTELRTSLEGLPGEFAAGDRLAVAIGSTVRLNSSPRSTWIGYGNEGVFDITANGELRALQAGYGAVLVQHKDERNNVYRETLLHVEVSPPVYCTLQAGVGGVGALRAVARSSQGRALLAPGAVLAVTPPVAVPRAAQHAALGKELLLTSLEAPGAYVTVEAEIGAVTVRDEVWISSADLQADQLVAAGSSIICLPGGGWQAPPGVSLFPGDAVTLAVLVGDAPGRHVLRSSRGSGGGARTVHQLPIDKMDILPGESGQLISILSISAEGLSGSSLVCSEEERMNLEGFTLELPFACHTQPPHNAKAVVDFVNAQIGCTIIPATITTEPSDVELCAEWGLHRTCTKVLLIPPITLTSQKLSLLDPPTEFTVRGHSKALRSVTLTSSPDLKIERFFKNEELTIVISASEVICGSGWVVVRSPLTDQEFRVEVEKECDVACRTILGAFFSLLKPYLSTLVTMAGVAAASYYVLSKQVKPIQVREPPRLVTTPLSNRTSETRSLNRSTWSRSPYASGGPAAPVYGDTSVLPDSSFSPNTTRVNSRFL